MNPIAPLPDLTYAVVDGLPLLLDLYLPAGIAHAPLVMYIHGGGWRNGSRADTMMNWLAEHGYAVASIDYRLSDQALFPAQIHDCKGALRWLRAHAAEYDFDASVVSHNCVESYLACVWHLTKASRACWILRRISSPLAFHR